jgi:hypothetical protein
VPFTVRNGLEVRGKGMMTTFVLEAGSVEAALARAAADEAGPPPEPMPRRSTPSSAAGEAAAAAAAQALSLAAPAVPIEGSAEDAAAAPPDAASAMLARRGSVDLTAGAALAGADGDADATAAEQLSPAASQLARKALVHFGTSVLFSSTPIVAYCAVSLVVLPDAWTQRGGAAGAATAAALRPLVAVVATLFALAAAGFVRGALTPGALCVRRCCWLKLLLAMQFSAMLLTYTVLVAEYLSRAADNCAAPRVRGSAPDAPLQGLPSASCVRVYFWTLHFPIFSCVWLTSQLPHNIIFFPEARTAWLGLAWPGLIAH